MEVFFMTKHLKPEYLSEEELKQDLAEFNKSKSPDEQLYYCSYLNSFTHKRMYVPCSKEWFFAWRNMMKAEHEKRWEKSRCYIISDYKKNTEVLCRNGDCENCPHKNKTRYRQNGEIFLPGDDVENGGVLSLDQHYEQYGFEPEDPSYKEQEEKEQRDALMDEIWHEISLLDELSQKILTLFNDGLSDSEIGSKLGLKRSTVQYQRTKLLDELKEKLKKF
jgi:hypothetical protein